MTLDEIITNYLDEKIREFKTATKQAQEASKWDLEKRREALTALREVRTRTENLLRTWTTLTHDGLVSELTVIGLICKEGSDDPRG